jgi:hypothetical protein
MSTLKDRVAQLETQFEELKSTLQRERGKDWRRAVEKYAGDSDLQAVFAEALTLREADRKKASVGQRRRKQG